MIFDFDDYRAYLVAAMDAKGERRGKRSRLAQFLGCETSFVSQVLTGRSHFSLEHSIRASDFLGHTSEEKHYFMLLVQKGKAGSRPLESYYDAQIAEVRKRRQVVRERIQVKDELKLQDQMTYYSAWWFVAAHILCALPGTQTRDEITRKLSLPAEVVNRTLDFLLGKGLIKEESGHYSIGAQRIHLGTASPLLPRHHSNWRMKAMQAVDHPKAGDLHYSGVIGISKKDGERVRAMMLDLLQKSEVIVQESKEDTAYVMLMDFFEL
jgi:uncharacterized protein (TIGR02147 family)